VRFSRRLSQGVIMPRYRDREQFSAFLTSFPRAPSHADELNRDPKSYGCWRLGCFRECSRSDSVALRAIPGNRFQPYKQKCSQKMSSIGILIVPSLFCISGPNDPPAISRGRIFQLAFNLKPLIGARFSETPTDAFSKASWRQQSTSCVLIERPSFAMKS